MTTRTIAHLAGVAVALLLLATCSWASREASEDDVVLDLPGWSGPLPSRWFSGHVFAGKKEGKTLYHHYILIESEKDPIKDPVVVWSNGGPGASSIFGLMIELGPLLITGTSNGRLLRNQESWSKEANLIIINGPPPVGFSYCDPPGPTGDFHSCGARNDSTTAYHNRLAVEGILARHPRLKNNQWFFTGESYAGVYIPMLVRELLDYGTKSIRIAGMAVGNACVGTSVLCFSDSDYWWRALFLRGHIQVSEKSYRQFEEQCRATMEIGVATEKCKSLVKGLEKEAGGFYEYDLYSECFYDGDFQPPKSYFPWRKQTLAGTIGGDDFCGGDDTLNAWLKTPQVRRALNVKLDATHLSADNGDGFVYTYGEKDLRPFYNRLIKNKIMRVMVFSGDVDVSVNTLATQNWTESLGFKEKQAWRPWTLDGGRAIGGHVVTYENDFSMVTIKGSGHMVPQFKAKAGSELLRRFLKKQSLQSYDPKKGKPKQSFTSSLNEAPVS